MTFDGFIYGILLNMNINAETFNSYIDAIRERHLTRIQQEGNIAIAISRDDFIEDMQTIWPDCKLSESDYVEPMLAVYLCIANMYEPRERNIIVRSVETLAMAHYSDSHLYLESVQTQSILAKFNLCLKNTGLVVDFDPNRVYKTPNYILQKIRCDTEILYRMYSTASIDKSYDVPEIVIGPLDDLPSFIYNVIQHRGTFSLNMQPSKISVYSEPAELYPFIEWIFESKVQAMHMLLKEWLANSSFYDIEHAMVTTSKYEREVWITLFEHFLCNHSSIKNITDINKTIKLQHDLGVDLKDIVLQMCMPETIGLDEQVEFGY